VGIGKAYRKENQTLRGAALFYLALEKNGGHKLGGANEIMKAAFRDLGVTDSQVEKYIEENRAELEEILARRKTGTGGTHER